MKNLYTITFDSDSTDDESSNQQASQASKSSSNVPNSNARIRQLIRHPKTKVTTINLSEESKRHDCSSLVDSYSYSSNEIIYSDSYETSDEHNSNKIETKIEKVVKSNENCDSPDISGNIEPKPTFKRHLKSNSKPLNLSENQKANTNENQNHHRRSSKHKNGKTEKTVNSDSNPNDTNNSETKNHSKIDSNNNETNKTDQTVKHNNETVQTANINSNNNETANINLNNNENQEAESVDSNPNNNNYNDNENHQQNEEPLHFKIIRKMKAKGILNKKSSFDFTDLSNNCFFEAKPEKGSHSIISIFGGSHYEQLCSQTPSEILNSTNGQLGVVICSPEMDSFSLRLNNQYGKEMMSVRVNSKKCKNSSSSVFADQKGIARSELNPNFDLNGNIRLLKVNFFINGMNNDMKLQNIESYGKSLDFGQRSVLQSTKNFILVDTFQNEIIAVRKTEKNCLCVDFQQTIPAICAFTIGLIAFLYKV